MKRSIIIAKCIGTIENSTKTLLIFDKPLKDLCSKFVYIKNYFGTLLPSDIIEISSHTTIEVNKYYKITVYNDHKKSGDCDWEWDIINQSMDEHKEETVLLWQELGSLIDPPIETIDLYIDELNKRT